MPQIADRDRPTASRLELREKAQVKAKWVSAVQYLAAGQRLDDAALAHDWNGLPSGTIILDFTGFRVSPVRDMGGSIEVCDPGEHAFWSVYGFHREAQEWQIVHDALSDDIGESLARIVELTGELVEYRDLSHAYANTRLPDLVDLLAQRILDEIPDQDAAGARADDADTHPLSYLREQIRAAIEKRRA
ncbi:hypothetical protein [Paracoccus salsus]|uniref:hypothetical protein n=1 Tax=Paracoccus salsus TaxID=2911061 RepID=UPI001F44776B|nr:hypothetical protein [Paracoccus salsus]MCF3974825.1 hypothetical protein [Paracoccus salsus]